MHWIHVIHTSVTSYTQKRNLFYLPGSICSAHGWVVEFVLNIEYTVIKIEIVCKYYSNLHYFYAEWDNGPWFVHLPISPVTKSALSLRGRGASVTDARHVIGVRS